MRGQEKYWGFRAPDTPEFSDLRDGVFQGAEQEWNSLSPGYRREICRLLIRDKVNLDAYRMKRADDMHERAVDNINRRESL